MTSSSTEDFQERHLEWTKKQGHVLTGGGKAEEFYTAERGFPFQETDLPHYHLLQDDTHATFKPLQLKSPDLIVAGAWNRPLFSGGWKHSSDKEERVYNLQSNNLFIDFRVPRTRDLVFRNNKATSLNDLGPTELRWYARQHIFAGVTLVETTKDSSRPVATRHHFIDWNFVGAPRSRPNKWWIHVKENDDCVTSWKEFAYATDNYGQHYYFEQWDRLEKGLPTPRLAMRVSSVEKRKVGTDINPRTERQRDGLFVLVGDHFNYVLGRTLSGNEGKYESAKSLVDLVDAAVANDDLVTARSYLTIEGGHGRISNDWKLDCAIPHWNEGTPLCSKTKGQLEVVGDDLATCSIVFRGFNWDLYDCSFETVEELKAFFIKSSIEK